MLLMMMIALSEQLTDAGTMRDVTVLRQRGVVTTLSVQCLGIEPRLLSALIAEKERNRQFFLEE